MRILGLLLAVVLTALVLPAFAAEQLKVQITSNPPRIYAGDVYEITVQTEPGAVCKFEVRFSTPWYSEERKANSRGIVTRKFYSSRNTRQGTVRVIVSCELGDRKGFAETDLTVQ